MAYLSDVIIIFKDEFVPYHRIDLKDLLDSAKKKVQVGGLTLFLWENVCWCDISFMEENDVAKMNRYLVQEGMYDNYKFYRIGEVMNDNTVAGGLEDDVFCVGVKKEFTFDEG